MTTWEAAQALLVALTAAFEAAGRPHPRRFVSDGGVLFDWTPLLAVEWDRNEPASAQHSAETAGSPADMSHGMMVLRSVFSIHVTRDSPWPDEVGTPPTPAMVQASGRIVHLDALLVLTTLQKGMSNGTLFGSCCEGMFFISQSAVGPDGGVVGSVTTIAVAL